MYEKIKEENEGLLILGGDLNARASVEGESIGTEKRHTIRTDREK